MKAGWQIKRLGDVCTIRPPKDEARKQLGLADLVSFVPMEDLGIDQKYLSPTQSKLLNEVVGGYTYFYEGDVLLAKITPCFENGKLGIAQGLENKIGFGSSEYIVFRPIQALNNEYLYYFLSRQQFRDEGAQRMSGAVGHKRVSKEFIDSYPIPFPPLSEQQRIVSILDEAFDGIAVAKTTAEQNLKNARELFDSHLQSVFVQQGEGWLEKKLGDICIVDRGSSPRPIKNYITTEPDGVNWIRISDATQSEKYIYSTKTKITPEGAKKSRFVEENDFILTNSMSFGRPYIMKTTGYIHDGWFVIRLKSSVDLNYFYYLLISPYVREQFNSLASGAIVLNISGDLVKRAILPIPPIEEQHSIVARLDDLSAETQRLESVYQQKITALDELKQSLLHRAFAGEL